jgi:hypothetical protein
MDYARKCLIVVVTVAVASAAILYARMSLSHHARDIVPPELRPQYDQISVGMTEASVDALLRGCGMSEEQMVDRCADHPRVLRADSVRRKYYQPKGYYPTDGMQICVFFDSADEVVGKTTMELDN